MECLFPKVERLYRSGQGDAVQLWTASHPPFEI